MELQTVQTKEIFTEWRCAVILGGKRKYIDFSLIGDSEDAYRHVVRKYGMLNFRSVYPRKK